MSNDYFTASGAPTTGSFASSAVMRSQFSSVEDGFDKLPALTGNGSKAVIVNSGATGLTVTTGALALAGDFATSGAFSVTLTATATTAVTLPTTGTLATLAGSETLTNKTITSPSIGGTVTGSATYESPTLVTPTLGVATATSINKVAITAPASSATLTIVDGNTLSFEEGTFTPSMSFATPGTSSFVYGSQTGYYQKAGAWVSVYVDLAVTPTIGTGSGDVRIEGLPFAAGLTAAAGSMGSSDADITWPTGATQLVPLTSASQTYIILRGLGSVINGANVQASNLTGGNVNTIRFTLRYKV